MPHNEQTSPEIAKLAARALRDPASLTHDEIQSLAASALTQAPDHETIDEQAAEIAALILAEPEAPIALDKAA